MRLTAVQDQAIQGILASTLGAEIFDSIFSGVQFDELDETMLYAYAPDEDSTEKIASGYADHVLAVASLILRRNVGILVILERPTIVT